MGEPKEEVKINCAKCNKPLKRIRRYYRNGKFFCNTKCFKAAQAKSDAKPS